MADPYDIFTEGVPNARTGAPSVFGSGGVDIYQARALSQSRLANESAFLETRDKLNTYRDREATRVQGRQVMEILPKLDPRSPDYQTQVKDVLAKNPNAMLDKTVVTFLDVQGDIFDQFEAERQEKEELDRRLELEKAGHDLMLEREKTRLKDVGVIQREQTVENAIFQLPTDRLEEFNKLRESGLDQTTAYKKVEEQMVNEDAINKLYEMGFDDPDIFGNEVDKPGVVDKDGNIDPRKYSKIVGEAKRREADKAERKEKEDKLRARIQIIEKDLESRQFDDIKDPVKIGLAERLSALRSELDSLIAGPQTVAPTTQAPAAPGTPASAPPQHPDLEETDRYIPKG